MVVELMQPTGEQPLVVGLAQPKDVSNANKYWTAPRRLLLHQPGIGAIILVLVIGTTQNGNGNQTNGIHTGTVEIDCPGIDSRLLNRNTAARSRDAQIA